MNPCKPLYLWVTSDKYELPLAVADSMEELARMAGVTVGTVTSSISRRKRAKRPGPSIRSYGCPGEKFEGGKAMNEEMKMTQEREGRILEAAIDTWGSEMQIIVAIEEMSELTKALTKYIRGDDAATISVNIREEMADVGIMLNQLSLIFGDTAEEEIRKLNRLRRRIEDVTGETLF